MAVSASGTERSVGGTVHSSSHNFVEPRRVLCRHLKNAGGRVTAFKGCRGQDQLYHVKQESCILRIEVFAASLRVQCVSSLLALLTTKGVGRFVAAVTCRWTSLPTSVNLGLSQPQIRVTNLVSNA